MKYAVALIVAMFATIAFAAPASAATKHHVKHHSAHHAKHHAKHK